MSPSGAHAEHPLGAREGIAVIAILIAAAGILHLMGQPWWCQQGDTALWSSQVASAHNSQHLGDPYTLTHLLHGFAFYMILWTLGRDRWSARDRFVAAMAVEGAWELFENTDFVINRYREATISLDYFGDSVVNSLGDIVACAIGYVAAMALPTGASVAAFAGVEFLLILWIRDSLLLNILMLLWPIETIRTWQSGG